MKNDCTKEEKKCWKMTRARGGGGAYICFFACLCSLSIVHAIEPLTVYFSILHHHHHPSISQSLHLAPTTQHKRGVKKSLLY